MEKLAFKDYVIITLLGMNRLEPDGSITLKGRNKIIYPIVVRLIGGEQNMDKYTHELLNKMKASGYDVDDLLRTIKE